MKLIIWLLLVLKTHHFELYLIKINKEDMNTNFGTSAGLIASFSTIEKGEFCFYKTKEGLYTMYYVNRKAASTKGIEIDLIGLTMQGDKDLKKKFTTALVDGKGKCKIFRIPIQPGDKVHALVSAGRSGLFKWEEGKVERFFVNHRGTGDFDNIVEIVCNNRQHLFNFGEVPEKVKVLGVE